MRRPRLAALVMLLAACPAPVLVVDGDGGEAGVSAGAGGSGASGGTGGRDDCSELGDTCNVGVLEDGACVRLPHADGTSCDDGLSCTTGEVCQAGACTGGVPPSCLPPSPCHVVTCEDTTGQCVIATGNDGAPCNDLDPCTTVDSCVAGACVGGGPEPDCSYLEGECAASECEPGVGCVMVPLAGPCTDDDNSCTTDVCADGQCQYFPNTGSPCDSGNDCLAGFCSDFGACIPLVPAFDGSPCEASFCLLDESCLDGACSQGTPREDCPAPDHACWAVSCSALGGSFGGSCLAEIPAPGGLCDEACLTGGSCDSGVCSGGTPANEGGACEDHNACTQSDACAAGACEGIAITSCVDGDGCCPAGCSAASDDDCSARLYLSNTSGSSGFYVLDLSLGTWSTLPDPPVTTQHRLASDGHFVFLMGVDHNVYRFDPSAETWSFLKPGPGANLPAGGMGFPGFMAWTSQGLVMSFDPLHPWYLFRELGPAWGAQFIGTSTVWGNGTFDRQGARVLGSTSNGVFTLDLTTGASNEVGVGWAFHRGGAYVQGTFYVPQDAATGSELWAVDVTTGAVTNTGVLLDGYVLFTEADPEGHIYFAPASTTGTFQVLHTATMTLEPLPPPPPLPPDSWPTLVLARAPSE